MPLALAGRFRRSAGHRACHPPLQRQGAGEFRERQARGTRCDPSHREAQRLRGGGPYPGRAGNPAYGGRAFRACAPHRAGCRRARHSPRGRGDRLPGDVRIDQPVPSGGNPPCDQPREARAGGAHHAGRFEHQLRPAPARPAQLHLPGECYRRRFGSAHHQPQVGALSRRHRRHPRAEWPGRGFDGLHRRLRPVGRPLQGPGLGGGRACREEVRNRRR